MRWDSHMNTGIWVEEQRAGGIDKVSGEFVRVMGIRPGHLRPNEYEVADVDCLTEWVHAAATKIVKRYITDHNIDAEIDFKIDRDKDDRYGSERQEGTEGAGAMPKVRSFLKRVG